MIVINRNLYSTLFFLLLLSCCTHRQDSENNKMNYSNKIMKSSNTGYKYIDESIYKFIFYNKKYQFRSVIPNGYYLMHNSIIFAIQINEDYKNIYKSGKYGFLNTPIKHDTIIPGKYSNTISFHPIIDLRLKNGETCNFKKYDSVQIVTIYYSQDIGDSIYFFKIKKWYNKWWGGLCYTPKIGIIGQCVFSSENKNVIIDSTGSFNISNFKYIPEKIEFSNFVVPDFKEINLANIKEFNKK